jgi:predicted thioesterase
LNSATPTGLNTIITATNLKIHGKKLDFNTRTTLAESTTASQNTIKVNELPAGWEVGK